MNFPHFLGLYNDAHDEPLTVCRIPRDLARQIGSRSNKVILSHATMRKQRINHPELTSEHYKALKPCLMMGEYRKNGPRSALIIFVDALLLNCGFRAAVKATEMGHEMYVTSFNALRDRQLRKEQRRANRKGFPIIKEHS